MTEVISVKFRGKGKAYFFGPEGIQIPSGSKVVVETSKGLELGDCTVGNHMVDDTRVVPPLRPVIRIATEDDLRIYERNRVREKEAFDICLEKIAKHGLEMKLVDVEVAFEGNKILFFFTADGRVDFRELVKDLAGVFRTRIELRQIGVRDEAKMLGGLGICGRPFCCSQFLDDFAPVSTKMAKTQSMSLNPTKISGSCGRLMCCLRYEQEAYEDLVTHVPKTGAFVQTTEGYGSVVSVNLLRQNVRVRLDGTGDPVIHTFDVGEFAEVPGGRPAEGEPLPDVLRYVPKPKEEAKPEEEPWRMPRMIPEEPVQQEPEEEVPEAPAEEEKSGKKRSRHRRHSSSKSGEKQPAKEEVIRVERVKEPDKEKAKEKTAKTIRAERITPPAEAGANAGGAAKKKSSHHRRRRPSGRSGSGSGGASGENT